MTYLLYSHIRSSIVCNKLMMRVVYVLLFLRNVSAVQSDQLEQDTRRNILSTGGDRHRGGHRDHVQSTASSMASSVVATSSQWSTTSNGGVLKRKKKSMRHDWDVVTTTVKINGLISGSRQHREYAKSSDIRKNLFENIEYVLHQTGFYGLIDGIHIATAGFKRPEDACAGYAFVNFINSAAALRFAKTFPSSKRTRWPFEMAKKQLNGLGHPGKDIGSSHTTNFLLGGPEMVNSEFLMGGPAGKMLGTKPLQLVRALSGVSSFGSGVIPGVVTEDLSDDRQPIRPQPSTNEAFRRSEMLRWSRARCDSLQPKRYKRIPITPETFAQSIMNVVLSIGGIYNGKIGNPMLGEKNVSLSSDLRSDPNRTDLNEIDLDSIDDVTLGEIILRVPHFEVWEITRNPMYIYHKISMDVWKPFAENKLDTDFQEVVSIGQGTVLDNPFSPSRLTPTLIKNIFVDAVTQQSIDGTSGVAPMASPVTGMADPTTTPIISLSREGLMDIERSDGSSAVAGSTVTVTPSQDDPRCRCASTEMSAKWSDMCDQLDDDSDDDPIGGMIPSSDPPVKVTANNLKYAIVVDEHLRKRFNYWGPARRQFDLAEHEDAFLVRMVDLYDRAKQHIHHDRVFNLLSDIVLSQAERYKNIAQEGDLEVANLQVSDETFQEEIEDGLSSRLLPSDFSDNHPSTGGLRGNIASTNRGNTRRSNLRPFEKATVEEPKTKTLRDLQSPKSVRRTHSGGRGFGPAFDPSRGDDVDDEFGSKVEKRSASFEKLVRPSSAPAAPTLIKITEELEAAKTAAVKTTGIKPQAGSADSGQSQMSTVGGQPQGDFVPNAHPEHGWMHQWMLLEMSHQHEMAYMPQQYAVGMKGMPQQYGMQAMQNGMRQYGMQDMQVGMQNAIQKQYRMQGTQAGVQNSMQQQIQNTIVNAVNAMQPGIQQQIENAIVNAVNAMQAGMQLAGNWPTSMQQDCTTGYGASDRQAGNWQSGIGQASDWQSWQPGQQCVMVPGMTPAGGMTSAPGMVSNAGSGMGAMGSNVDPNKGYLLPQPNLDYVGAMANAARGATITAAASREMTNTDRNAELTGAYATTTPSVPYGYNDDVSRTYAAPGTQDGFHIMVPGSDAESSVSGGVAMPNAIANTTDNGDGVGAQMTMPTSIPTTHVANSSGLAVTGTTTPILSGSTSVGGSLRGTPAGSRRNSGSGTTLVYPGMGAPTGVMQQGTGTPTTDMQPGTGVHTGVTQLGMGTPTGVMQQGMRIPTGVTQQTTGTHTGVMPGTGVVQHAASMKYGFEHGEYAANSLTSPSMGGTPYVVTPGATSSLAHKAASGSMSSLPSLSLPSSDDATPRQQLLVVPAGSLGGSQAVSSRNSESQSLMLPQHTHYPHPGAVSYPNNLGADGYGGQASLQRWGQQAQHGYGEVAQGANHQQYGGERLSGSTQSTIVNGENGDDAAMNVCTDDENCDDHGSGLVRALARRRPASAPM